MYTSQPFDDIIVQRALSPAEVAANSFKRDMSYTDPIINFKQI